CVRDMNYYSGSYYFELDYW
nr:immunoglobulin heavy chain junction region [Macaca mulatta]MOW94319.1 immunoglobulin heavy chain junction region [Macaca mulatta]MOW94943.1 immunoglobulin heavy chain junction region [Macaca mulatta]MOW94972.1 immunoglobulin heavy chain junction region [Macaca mulatta]MOW96514.1 immunoglobulin heavy chain junction region [Macaca mulatta]